ncbi:NHLP leader peptide family natural product precursor [Nakamurella sp. YIM 132087]|uniref:NHLP leader peptide family natural product n=1 Tax=Nakamurella alba TaxID=2665158 RepID=A0A7K1FL79_9ACTN|nr:NHLP leader peptide family RiPP precursor [Nakamurella alba]MTD13983.1 NHLP leader peptide family natural product precursor [Nakamurella alba]
MTLSAAPATETTPAPLDLVRARAAFDPEFRAALLADPRAVLAEAGVVVPETISITVAESTDDNLVLALPPVVDESAELTEDGLADVSGGATPMVVIGLMGMEVVKDAALGYLAWTAGAGAVFGAGYAGYKKATS